MYGVDLEMSNRGSSQRGGQSARRISELSPELREFLHMLEAIEETPSSSTDEPKSARRSAA